MLLAKMARKSRAVAWNMTKRIVMFIIVIIEIIKR